METGKIKFKKGDKASFEHTITNEDVRKFVELTGDDNPLHVDAGYASKTPFKGIVTHGMLSASFISTLIGKYIPGEGALWVSQNLSFLLPVRLGDTLSVEALVTDVNERERLLSLETTILNQNKQKVLTGEAKVKIVEQVETVSTINRQLPKVALITGGAGGIGRAVCLRLAKEGYKIAINYHSAVAKAKELEEQIKNAGGEALAFKCDITDSAEVKKMFSNVRVRFGNITVLVNNASSRIVAQKFEELEWAEIEKHHSTQLKGAYNCIQEAYPQMLEAGGGSIINIGSIVTDFPPEKWLAYTLAKTALHSLTKCLALEFGPRKIRVNSVSAGMTDTSFISDIPEKSRMLQAMQTPLRRLAMPDDIAGAVAFLAGSDSQFITGENIRVAGGKSME